jgi:hypothetical protein
LSQSNYKPTKFSVCVICDETSFEVEVCIEQKGMPNAKLIYERRYMSDSYQCGTLAWSQAENPVGLKVDMSKEGLLSTLQNIQAITDSSLQSFYLNCPYGFKLERLELRTQITQKSSDRPCLICSTDQYSFSSCFRWTHYNDYFNSALFPSRSVDQNDCPEAFNSSGNICQFDVKHLMKENQTSSGVYFEPYGFERYYQKIKAENLKIDVSKGQLENELIFIIPKISFQHATEALF